MTNTITQDTEREVLGAFLIDGAFSAGECRALGLAAGDFADARHAVLYDLFLGIVDRGEPLVRLAVRRACEAMKIPACADDEYDVMADAVPTAVNVRYAAKCVMADARARRNGESVTPVIAQDTQVAQALAYADLSPDRFLPWPWPRLDVALGGLSPAALVFVAAFTGGGKTSFLLSLMCRWIATGQRVVYAGLESGPLILRTQLACRVVGLDPGFFLSGDYLRAPDGERVREMVKVELRRQREAESYRRIHFAPHTAMTAAVARELLHQARDFGADALIIDHIDHGAVASGGSHWAESRSIVSTVHELGQRLGVRIIAATQTNSAGLLQDPLRNHRPVRSEQVFMGGHKGHVADLFLGLYRPMRADTTREQLADVRDGRAEVATILARNTIGVNVMKHRAYGERTGKIVALGFWHGDVTDQPLRAITSGAA